MPASTNAPRPVPILALCLRPTGHEELQTFLEFPPMQRGASFNLDAVKAEMAKRMQQAEAGAKGPGR